MKEIYVIGLDFGTDSVRSLLVNTSNGNVKASHVFEYPRWRLQKYCDPSVNKYRQHIQDHIEGMEATIMGVLQESKIDPSTVKGLCIDTTGSSPVPVAKDGTPLCLTKIFEENPNAMMVLWKDHTAIREADEINRLAKTWGGEDYTKYEGGIYSSEWFWAKILHIVRNDEKIKQAAWSWMEHCDMMTYILTGNNNPESFKHSRCAAGHKAMWHKSWGGLPSTDFLVRLDPYLGDVRNNLYTDTYTSDVSAGKLNETWSVRLGLSPDTVVAVGTFDAHAGAVGAEVKEHTLVRIMGTSTCDILVASENVIGEKTIKGICGQVDGSVIPGMVGLEAGQSAFGDLLAWFRDVLNWATDNILAKSALLDERLKIQLTEEMKVRLIEELSNAAEKIPVGDFGPVALDWINGRRTPDANQSLKAAIMGLTLGTDAPLIFRSLTEAICFGAKKIVERFSDEGIKIDTIVGIGGVAKKSPFIMQTLANVLDRPIKIAVSDQAPALGAAIYAAVAADIYPDVLQASKQMGSGFETVYHPQPEHVEVYKKRYDRYTALGDFVESQTDHMNE
ncbi:MAG: ribulokinase [Candidatus Curtissbacteria bacterium]